MFEDLGNIGNIGNIKDLSVNQIIKYFGKLVTPDDLLHIGKTYEDRLVFSDFVNTMMSDIKNKRDEMFDFLVENEASVDKEALVLMILKNYLECRSNKGNYNAGEQYALELKIERGKRLLDDIDIARYTFLEDSETGKINEIIEISSVELCAEKGMDNLKIYAGQKKVNNRRQVRYNARKEKNEKMRRRNLRMIKEIENDFDLKTVIQFANLNDYEDIILSEKDIGIIIRNMILRNSVIEANKFDYKQITKILSENRFNDYTENVDSMIYFEQTEECIKKYAEFFDIDKLLLCSAYRAVQRVKVEDFDEENLKKIKIVLQFIEKKLEGKKTRLVGQVEDDVTGEKVDIDYDISKLKEDLDRFTDSNMFLTDDKIKEIKDLLISGQKSLKDYSSDTIWKLQFENVEWDKIIKMSSKNFLFYLEESRITEADLKEIISEISNISTECLYKLIEKGLISQSEIVEICDGQKVELKQLVELATVDFIEDSTIIDSFNALKEKEDNKLLYKNLLLEYFDIEKIQEYINNNQIDEKFLEFYKNILPEDKEQRNIISNKINGLVSGIEDKSIIIKFYNAKLIGQEKLIEKVNDNDILELYENGKIDVNTVNELHRLRIIEHDTMALVIDEEYKTGDIMKGLEDGTIDISIALELYPDKKIYGTFKKYNEGIFKSPNPAIYAFMTSNMEIEDIDKLYKKGIVKEQDLKDIIMQGKISKAKITELYINMLISQEIIDDLNKNKILTDSDTELMKKALGMKNIVKNMDKSLGIAFGSDGEIEIDDGIFLPEEKTGKKEREYDVYYFPNGNKSKEPKKVISPAIRERKFEIYGAKRVKRNNVEYNEKSPFNDYEFYIIPDEQGNRTPDCIVIAERYYEDKHSGEEKLVDGNATYLFELKDLTRISKKSKTEILSEMKEAKDKRMKRKLHTKNWSKNMDKAVEELLGRKLESCYTESEIHDIRTISELIDGFKDKGETYRMFDVEFY